MEEDGSDRVAGDLTIGELFAGQATSLPSVADGWGHVDLGAQLSAPKGCTAPGALSIY